MASSSSAVAWLSAANEQMAEHHAAQAKRKAEEAAEEEEGVEEAVAEEAVAEEEAAEEAVPAAGSGSFLDDPKPASGEPTACSGPGPWGQKGKSSRPAAVAKPKSQSASSSLMAPPPPPPLPLGVPMPDLPGGGPPSWTWVAGHEKGLDHEHEYELQMNFEPKEAEQACQVDDEPFGCSCWLYITFVSCLVCDQMSC
jgi:hypothetical protein